LAPVMGMPIYHPSYLKQWGQSKKQVTVNDLRSGLGQRRSSATNQGSGVL
jgi:uracil-DNA glycosylase